MMSIFRRLLGKPAQGSATVRCVHVVAHPKSGQTWTRLFLGRYAQAALDLPETPLFDGGETIPTADGDVRIIFTHAPLTWETQRAEDLSPANCIEGFHNGSVCLQVRYPLDLIVSLYMQQTHQVTGASKFDGSIKEFVRHPVFGMDKLLRFHQIWASAHEQGVSPLILRYEDLLDDPADRIGPLVALAGFRMDRSKLRQAADEVSFGRMKAMQASGDVPRYKTSGLPIFGTVKAEDPRSHHVRRGGSGHYRDEMPAALAEELEDRVSREMPAIFGYAVPPKRRSIA